jgi:hypothetical protein
MGAVSDLTLIDTDIIIDAGRSIREAIACLQTIEQRSTSAISVITQMELLVGCRSKTELRALEQFLTRFQIVTLNESVSDRAVDLLHRYRLSHGLLIADSLIAATALWLDGSLVTKNQSDFRYIAGLKLLPDPQPFAVET